MQKLCLVFVFFCFLPCLTAGRSRSCPPVPPVWRAVFDNPEYSLFSELVQATYPCPPSLDNGSGITIFAVPDSVLSELNPSIDPLYTNKQFRELVMGLHILPNEKVEYSSGSLIWKERITSTPCGSVRGLSSGSRPPTVGLFGVGGGSFSFAVSPAVLNGAEITHPDAINLESGVVHQLGALLEPTSPNVVALGDDVAPHAAQFSAIWKFQEYLATHPSAILCPTTHSTVDDCACCPNNPILVDSICRVNEVSAELEFYASTGDCSQDRSAVRLAVRDAIADALELDLTQFSFKILGCEMKAEPTSQKLHTLADRAWFRGALFGVRGQNNANFRRKVREAILNPSAPWRQKLIDTVAIEGFTLVVTRLEELGLVSATSGVICPNFKVVDDCSDCSVGGDAIPNPALPNTCTFICEAPPSGSPFTAPCHQLPGSVCTLDCPSGTVVPPVTTFTCQGDATWDTDIALAKCGPLLKQWRDDGCDGGSYPAAVWVEARGEYLPACSPGDPDKQHAICAGQGCSGTVVDPARVELSGLWAGDWAQYIDCGSGSCVPGPIVSSCPMSPQYPSQCTP